MLIAVGAPKLDKYYVVFDSTLAPEAGTAFYMGSGQVLRIVDVEGQQVPDLICFNRSDLADKFSPPNSQLLNGTIYLSVGHDLYSTRCNKLMTIVEDSCGTHDVISGSCSSYSNALRYGVRGTANCRDNFENALRSFGVAESEIPYSLNVFMNVPVSEGGESAIQEPKSKPGDYIDLRANFDLLVAISNCPQRRNPCNGWNPTPLELIVYEPQARKD